MGVRTSGVIADALDTHIMAHDYTTSILPAQSSTASGHPGRSHQDTPRFSDAKYALVPINGFVQDCGNSSADALELPQVCTKPLIWM